MSESERTKFRVYAIDGLNMMLLDDQRLAALSEAIVSLSLSAEWFGQLPSRYSLTKGFALPGGHVAAYITQQHSLDRHVVTDNKRESLEKIDSYEDRMLILHTRSNLLSLENKQFRGKAPLSSQRTLERVTCLLSDIVHHVGLADRVTLKAIDYTTSKPEFISLFFENRILGIRIDDFGMDMIPSDVELVNPDKQLEGATRMIVLHDREQNSVAKVEMDAPAEDGDLRRSAFARAALYSGAPAHMRYQRNDGEIRIRSKSETGEFEVSMTSFPTDTPEERTQMAIEVIRQLGQRDLPAGRDPSHLPRLQQTFDFPFSRRPDDLG